ncbi:MAG: hypothetical protein KDA78_17110 [Planctomycetaceae bacterium]|nr:hypothetical protein [Planctomycetaceae bacterium]
MKQREAIREIRHLVEMAHQQIQALYQTSPWNETFFQAGIVDGRDIVIDYLSHNEFGLAVEHLLYMIHESDISLELQLITRLHMIAECYHVSNPYI